MCDKAYTVRSGVPDILPKKGLPSLPFQSRQAVPNPKRIYFEVCGMYPRYKVRENGVSLGGEAGTGTWGACRLPFLGTSPTRHATPVFHQNVPVARVQ